MRRRKRSSGTYKIVFCYDIIYYSAACSLVPILTDCHYTLYRAHTALGTVTYPPPPPPLRPLLLQINKETASHAAPASATFIPHTQKTRVCVCVCPFFLSLWRQPWGTEEKEGTLKILADQSRRLPTSRQTHAEKHTYKYSVYAVQ